MLVSTLLRLPRDRRNGNERQCKNRDGDRKEATNKLRHSHPLPLPTFKQGLCRPQASTSKSLRACDACHTMILTAPDSSKRRVIFPALLYLQLSMSSRGLLPAAPA